MNKARIAGLSNNMIAAGVSIPELFDFVFSVITLASIERSKHWHGPQGVLDWSTLEWAGAMCGEAGEAANVAKKIIRYEHGMKNSAGDTELRILEEKLGKEIADTFLYLVLLAARRDLDLYAFVSRVFNEKSEEHGFPQRLPVV